MSKTVRTKALFKADFEMNAYDLYLPEEVWEKLSKTLHSNRVTVVLRMFNELTISDRDVLEMQRI